MYIKNGRRWSTVTETGIYGFFDKYRWLSNFYPVSVLYQGVLYPSSEHAYQAAKTDILDVRKHMARLPFDQIKNTARQLPRDPDWDFKKRPIMKEIVQAKFQQNETISLWLAKTHPLHLEESNNWGDKYWGTVDGVGLNHLGGILMETREIIR